MKTYFLVALERLLLDSILDDLAFARLLVFFSDATFAKLLGLLSDGVVFEALLDFLPVGVAFDPPLDLASGEVALERLLVLLGDIACPKLVFVVATERLLLLDPLVSLGVEGEAADANDVLGLVSGCLPPFLAFLRW